MKKVLATVTAIALSATFASAATRVKVECTPLKDTILYTRPRGDTFHNVYPDKDYFFIGESYSYKGQIWDFAFPSRGDGVNGWILHSLVACPK